MPAGSLTSHPATKQRQPCSCSFRCRPPNTGALISTVSGELACLVPRELSPDLLGRQLRSQPPLPDCQPASPASQPSAHSVSEPRSASSHSATVMTGKKGQEDCAGCSFLLVYQLLPHVPPSSLWGAGGQGEPLACLHPRQGRQPWAAHSAYLRLSWAPW